MVLKSHSIKYLLNKHVWELKDVKGNERLLLLCLVYHMNVKTRQCNPSWETMITETGMSRSTLGRVLHSLEDKKYIQRFQVKKSNWYSLSFYVSKRHSFKGVKMTLEEQYEDSKFNKTGKKDV